MALSKTKEKLTNLLHFPLFPLLIAWQQTQASSFVTHYNFLTFKRCIFPKTKSKTFFSINLSSIFSLEAIDTKLFEKYNLRQKDLVCVVLQHTKDAVKKVLPDNR